MKKRKLYRIPFLFLLLAGVSVELFSQTYNFKTYSMENGLAQSRAFSLFQDSKGYLWTGTNGGGISKFDGNTFTNFTEKDGLVNNVVFSIALDNEGHLLFGTNRNLSVYNGYTFENYTDTTGLTHNRVLRFFKNSKGIVWIATRKGVCQWQHATLKIFDADTTLSSYPILSMYENSKGNIWFGTYFSNVFCYDGKEEGFLGVECNANAAGMGYNGKIWFGYDK